MRRKRLRGPFTADEFAAIYPEPHDASRWHDHNVRVAVTVAFGKVIPEDARRIVGDLSCGDAQIARGLTTDGVVLGDFARKYAITGPLEDTLPSLDPVDTYVCSETLEHVNDPELVLNLIRPVTSWLVLTTPLEKWSDANHEHQWAWDRAWIEHALTAASFTVTGFNELDLTAEWSPYRFGMWVAR